MRRFLPLALTLCGSALAQTELKLQQLEQARFRQPVPLTLTVDNFGKAPVTLGRIRGDQVTCPVFKVFDHAGGPPRIERYLSADCDTGETVTIPAGQRQSYRVSLPWNDLKLGNYTAILEIPLNGKTRYVSAVVLVGQRPARTPNPDAYRDAVRASRARIYTGGTGAGRLMYTVNDTISRDAILSELKKRGLEANKIDIDVAKPVQFPGKPSFPHTADLSVERKGTHYLFTLKITNQSAKVVEAGARSACEPRISIERLSDGQRVWQTAYTPCNDLGMPSVPLQPGQSQSMRLEWDGLNSIQQRVPPGQYRVRMGFGQFVGEKVIELSQSGLSSPDSG